MKNKFKILSLIALFSIFVNATSVLAADLNPFTLEAYGIDTIAGYTAQIQSSKTLPDKTVIFTVKKPNGSKLTIPVPSGEDGVAEFDLYDYHTTQAGEYKVWAKLENGNNGDSNTFLVYPDEISTSKSKIESTKLLGLADGKDKIYITVTLQDKHKNPIQGHSIEVISSRSEDKIVRISEKTYTDKNGSMIFAVSSVKRGVSIYSFMDTTSGDVLSNRLEVAYTNLNDVGGFIPTAYAAAGEVDSLVFEDLPSSINTNSDVSFTLSAYDSENSIVPNYAGTIHFSVEGSNSIYASIPNDYTFDVDFDSGSHTFSGVNSLNFSEEGTYTVVATDKDFIDIRGEVEIVVGTATPQPPDTPSVTDELAVTSPTAGTYSDNQLTIDGVAPASNLTIQVFDNDQNIGSTDVEPDNTFSFQPSLLSDGEHTILVVALDGGGTIQYTSEEVTFIIDTSPPLVEDIDFSPSSGIKTGDVIDIIVTSDPDVFQGAVVFNVDIAELEQDPTDPTKYLASIQAPLEEGTYPVDVILVDELGNEGSYEDVATIEINADGDGTITGDEPEEPEEPVEEGAPSDVFGVRATSSDQRVTLTWQPATDDTAIDHYRVYYGLTPSNLTMMVDTLDNSPTWYVPNLQNGNEYFFSVSAFDEDGNESENKSSIVSAIPFTAAPVFIPPEPPPPAAAAIRPTAPAMQAYGPEMIWFVVGSFFLTQLYFKFRKKMC